MAHSFSHQIF